METRAKLFWRYVGPLLVAVELYNYFLLIRIPFAGEIACVASILVNSIIIMHLIQVKIGVEKHNAAIDASEQAEKTAAPEVVAAPPAVVPAPPAVVVVPSAVVAAAPAVVVPAPAVVAAPPAVVPAI
jgi:uncharacterized protein YhhL (DUF1145 family)